MTMKKLARVGLIGAAGFFASLSLFGGIGANANWEDEPEDGAAATSSEVPTNLWCAWYVIGMDADVSLYPIADLEKERIENFDENPIEDAELTEYDGSALTLTGYSLDTEALVAGYVSGALPTVSNRKNEDNVLIPDDPYDCSWYNAQQGFESSVSVDPLANQNFVATYGIGVADEEMDFGLSGATGDGIAITFIKDPSDHCDVGFTLADGAIIEDNSGTAVEVAAVAYNSALATTLTCKWDTKFVIEMPAQLTPAAPGEKYSFTGPTLKTTVTLEPAPIVTS